MLLADFMERAGASQMEDLLQTYETLENFGQLSESFYYRYATFYDGYCESVRASEVGVGAISNSWLNISFKLTASFQDE